MQLEEGALCYDPSCNNPENLVDPVEKRASQFPGLKDDFVERLGELTESAGRHGVVDCQS